MKAIISEECITQHKLLVCDLIVPAKPLKPICIPPKRNFSYLKDAGIWEEFEQGVTMKCQTIPTRVENSFKSIKNGLLDALDEACGWIQGGFPSQIPLQ